MTNKHKKKYKNYFFLEGTGVAMNDIRKHGVNKMLGNLGSEGRRAEERQFLLYFLSTQTFLSFYILKF